jgi:O-antigen/teichoic acid export membrane protein
LCRLSERRLAIKMAFHRKFLLYLAPTIWRAALGILTLPVFTLRLGPDDYGLLALVTALGTLGAGIAGAGLAATFAASLLHATDADRHEFVSTSFWLCMATTIGIGTLTALMWPLLAAVLDLHANDATWLVGGAIFLLCVLAGPWNIAFALASTLGNAEKLARFIFISATVGPVVGLLALFYADMGRNALLAGAIAAATVDALGSVHFLRHSLGRGIVRRYVAPYWKAAGTAFPAALAEQARATLERSLLAKFGSVALLGLVSHSWQYSNMVRMAAKAFSVTMWSISLNEARQEKLLFRRTTIGWHPLFVLVSVIGMGFAYFGRDLIGLLTHGKFADAYFFVCLWMVLILVESSGRPAVAVLYASGRVYANQTLLLMSAIVAMLCAVWWGNQFGVWGVVAAIFMQQVTYRIGVSWLTRAVREWPFDTFVLIGASSIFVALATVNYWDLSAAARAGCFLAELCVLTALAYPGLREALHLFLRREA